jgi:transposase InsO family protein
MRYSQAEKMEIIKMVEGSPLSVKQTLKEFNINRSTFYNWYGRYQEHGYDGLANTYNPPRQFWNEIPPWERQRVVDMALEHQDKSPRQLAWYITDSTGYYISESTVYRILKDHDLVTSPLYTLISAHEKFPKPTKVVNELWQTDFTFLKVVHWGWYYLSTVLDDYSRFILAWRLCEGMSADDVKLTLNDAILFTGIRHARVVTRPRLLSDNGPCYVSKALKDYLREEGIGHTRGKPFHPMTQGKIERYHRSMKNLILLDHYYSPSELEDQIRTFVDYYNNHRYHEALKNVTPADKYHGRDVEILERRELIKQNTMLLRKEQNHFLMLAEKAGNVYMCTETIS